MLKNEQGQVIGFSIIHSRGSHGTVEQYVDLTITGKPKNANEAYALKYFIKGEAKFYAWDTAEFDGKSGINFFPTMEGKSKQPGAGRYRGMSDAEYEYYRKIILPVLLEIKMINRGVHPKYDN